MHMKDQVLFWQASMDTGQEDLICPPKKSLLRNKSNFQEAFFELDTIETIVHTLWKENYF